MRGVGENMRDPGKRRRHGVGGENSLVLLLRSFINCCI